MANLGLLLKSLMGPRQTFQPGGGNLYQAMQEVQPPDPMQTSAAMPGMAPQPSGFGGGLRDLLDPSIAFPMAGAMMAADTPAESFGNALMLGGPALGKLKDQRRANDYLGKNFPDLAAMVNAGMPVDDAWKAALKKKTGLGDVSFGKNPIWGFDEQGNPVMGVVGDDGSFKQVDTPGFNISKTPIKLDAGTEWILLDPITRQPVGRIPKDLAGAEAEKARGEKQGEAQADLPRVEQNAQQTLGVLERMKTHPGREGATGFIQGVLPSRTADQVDFQSLVDQTQGQAFLQAFQMLKGGGHITEVEGQKATTAISRLGNQRLSDSDYLQAIADLEEVVNAGLARARTQAAGQTAPSPGGGGDYKSRYGLD